MAGRAATLARLARPALLALALGSAVAAQAPRAAAGDCSPGWEEVAWLETRMHLIERPAPDTLGVVVVSMEPADVGADDPAIAAETAGLKKLMLAMQGRGALRVWLRADADAPFRGAGRDPEVGLDGTAPSGSVLLRAYGFDGSAPRRVVLDGRGVVRRVVDGRLGREDLAFLHELLVEPAPRSRIVGMRLPSPVRGGAVRLDGTPLVTPGRWTLLRWWTDTCPFCEASLPAIDALCARFPQLDVVGVYHPKPPRPVAADAIREAAKERSFEGALAQDPLWLTQRGLRAIGLERGPTSISVLVAPDGTIRWVHPGPRLHRKIDGEHAEAEAAFVELEAFLHQFLIARARLEDR